MSDDDASLAKPAEASNPKDFVGDYLYRREKLRQLGDPRTCSFVREDARKNNSRGFLGYHPQTGVVVGVNSNDVDALPSDARMVTPMDYCRLKTERVRQWTPQREVWPLVHGQKLAILASGVGGYFINIHSRYFFHLVSQRMGTMAVAAVGVSGLMTYFGYSVFIHNPLLSGEVHLKEPCPLCYTLKGAFLHVICGTAFPFVFASVGGFAVAKLERTYPIPPLTDIRKVASTFKLSFLSMKRPLLIVSAFQAVFGSWLAYQAYSTELYIRSKDKSVFNRIKRGEEIPNDHLPSLAVVARCEEKTMRVRLEFAVQMTCGACVEAVENAMRRAGIHVESIDLENERLVVYTERSAHDIINLLDDIGKRALLRGAGSEAMKMNEFDFGSGACILYSSCSDATHSPPIQGVIRIFQLTDTVCRVEGTMKLDEHTNERIRTMPDGVKRVTVCVHEFGDLSDGCQSCGNILNELSNDHRTVGSLEDAEKYSGFVGICPVQGDGRCSFQFDVNSIQLWNLIGRSIVVHPGVLKHPNDVSQGIACGIIARSAGLFTNSKRICACDGVAIWDDTSKKGSV